MTLNTKIPEGLSEEDAAQFFKHPLFEQSRTFHATMTMENDGELVKEMNKRRRTDGSISLEDIKALYQEFDIEEMIGEWQIGRINYQVLTDYFNEDIVPTPVEDDVRMALLSATRFDDRIVLTKTLERSIYQKVDKILGYLGGKWNKSAGAHIFPKNDAQDMLENYLTTGKLEIVKPEKFGFFPTPEPLGKLLVKEASLKPSDRVLEPEGGSAAILNLIREIVPIEQIQTYEIQQHLFDKLKLMGYQAENTDFLSVEPCPIFDAILMNPPFERQQDIDHVLHAYKFLKPGGSLNAIMSYGTTFRNNKKSIEFREFLQQHDAVIIENDDNAFKESGTNVKTIRVRFEKPKHANITVPEVTTQIKKVAPQQSSLKEGNQIKIEKSRPIHIVAEARGPIQPLDRKPVPEDQISFDFF